MGRGEGNRGERMNGKLEGEFFRRNQSHDPESIEWELRKALYVVLKG